MNLSHKIQLDPTQGQITAFKKACGCARVAWNWGLATSIDIWDKTKKLPSGFDLNKKFNAIKRETYPWIWESLKDATQRSFINLGQAFTKAFSDKKAGKGWHSPKFKKKGQHDSFYIGNQNFPTSFKPGHFHVPKIGWIRLTEELRFTGKVLSATVSRTADRWYISFQVDVGDYSKPRTADGEIGIDLGLKSTIVTSDKQTFQAPKALKRYLSKLARVQRALARKQKGSKSQAKAKLEVAKVHQRIANIRNDWTHKTTTKLVQENKTICIEDLNVSGMFKVRSLARALSDVGFGEIRRQLTYKAPIYSTDLRVIPRFFPSSKKCSNCGNVKTKLALSERTYVCEVCGVSLDRDFNAALNIRTAGLAGIACRLSQEPKTVRSKVPRTRTKQESDTQGYLALEA